MIEYIYHAVTLSVPLCSYLENYIENGNNSYTIIVFIVQIFNFCLDVGTYVSVYYYLGVVVLKRYTRGGAWKITYSSFIKLNELTKFNDFVQ